MDDTGTVRWADGGPFGIVPVWVMEAEISDRAVRAYALLARHAGDGSTTFRGKRELADRMRCGRTAIDKAIAELVAIGAVSIEERHARNGARIENGYAVHAVAPSPANDSPPPRESGGGTPQARGATRARSLSENPSTTEPEQQEGLTPGRRLAILADISPGQMEVESRLYPATVDRLPVTDEEGALACKILHRWNLAAGQTLTSKDWLTKILRRIREHPELPLNDHVEIILANLNHPWWSGPPTPSVIYGNGAQFERAMITQAHGSTAGGDAALAVALDEQRRMEAGR